MISHTIGVKTNVISVTMTLSSKSGFSGPINTNDVARTPYPTTIETLTTSNQYCARAGQSIIKYVSNGPAIVAKMIEASQMNTVKGERSVRNVSEKLLIIRDFKGMPSSHPLFLRVIGVNFPPKRLFTQAPTGPTVA